MKSVEFPTIGGGGMTDDDTFQQWEEMDVNSKAQRLRHRKFNEQQFADWGLFLGQKTFVLCHPSWEIIFVRFVFLILGREKSWGENIFFSLLWLADVWGKGTVQRWES